MEGIKRKKISRGVLRSHCKKIEASINGIVEGDLDISKAIDLKSLKMNFEDKVAKIKAVDEEILLQINEEAELEAEMSNSMLECDIYYKTLSKIEHWLAKMSVTEKTSPERKLSSSSSPRLPRAVSEKVRLPKIELKKFDGDIMKWQTFWDQYESSVHEQPYLSAVDKFSYLRSLLNSTASACIAGLALTNENYNEAVLLLNERFGNKQLLINAYMEYFIKLQVVKSMNQIKELRTIYDQLEATVRNLKSLNVEMDTYGCFLVPISTQKLPSELKMIMSRSFKNYIWDLNGMLKIFKEELQAKERCSFPGGGNAAATKVIPEQFYSTSNLHQQVYTNRKRLCLFCNQADHSTSQCQNVTDIKSRVNILCHSKRCFICLQPNHIARRCRSEYRCNKCNKRHHISICDYEVNNLDNPVNANVKTTTCSNVAEKSVLLQTGRA